MTSKLDIAKAVINCAAGAGVSKVVHDIIKNNTDTETTAEAVKVAAGSIVIGSMVADRASEHVSAKVDKIAAWYADLKTKKSPTDTTSD